MQIRVDQLEFLREEIKRLLSENGGKWTGDGKHVSLMNFVQSFERFYKCFYYVPIYQFVFSTDKED